VEYEGLGPVLNRCRSPDDGDIVVPHPSAAVLGTTSVAVDDPDAFEEADWEVERSREECARMLPGVADAPAVRTWWGVRPLYEPDERARGGRGISRDFAVLDHGDEGVDGLFSVVGGKLTTHREMAEAVSDRAAEREGVTAPCRTADEPLAAADDPDRLDALVSQFDAGAPAEP
jgi:glycerol-3-phosphate dehydrogenase